MSIEANSRACGVRTGPCLTWVHQDTVSLGHQSMLILRTTCAFVPQRDSWHSYRPKCSIKGCTLTCHQELTHQIQIFSILTQSHLCVKVDQCQNFLDLRGNVLFWYTLDVCEQFKMLGDSQEFKYNVVLRAYAHHCMHFFSLISVAYVTSKNAYAPLLMVRRFHNTIIRELLHLQRLVTGDQ